jgi:CBS domain-containing protein
VARDAPLESLLGSEPLRRLGALVVVDPDGRLCGLVTLDRVRRALVTARPSATGPLV